MCNAPSTLREPIHERREIRLGHDPAPSRLGDQHRFATHERLSGQGATGVRRTGVDVRDDDMVQPECHDEFEPRRVLRRATAAEPVAVRSQILVEVSAVEVDDDVGRRHDLARDERQRTLGLGPARIARIIAVHALPIDRIEMRRHLLERLDVDDRHHDHRPREAARIDAGNELLHGYDRAVLGAVTARDERNHRTRVLSMDDGDGDRQCRIGSWRHGDRAGRGGPELSRRRSRRRRSRRHDPGRRRAREPTQCRRSRGRASGIVDDAWRYPVVVGAFAKRCRLRSRALWISSSRFREGAVVSYDPIRR